MIYLSKFYDLLHKSVTVTLIPAGGATTCYYHGPVSKIPDGYDNYVVTDFHMRGDGSLVFYIVKHQN